LLLSSLKSTAQFSDSDTLFFRETVLDFQAWLVTTKAADALTAKDFHADNQRVTLELTSKSRLEWLTLRNTYFDNFKEHIGEELLRTMAFQFEVPLDSAAILITCIADDYTVQVTYQEGKFVAKELFGLDIRMKGAANIVFEGLSTGMTSPIIAKNKDEDDIEVLKGRLIEHLQGYYENKAQFWGREASVDVLELDNEFTIEVTNISKEILNDFSIGYFEQILIEISMKPEDEDILINYDFRGKYGSGIFIAPRRTGYKDMSIKYADYVKRYDKKLRKMIADVVTSTPVRD
jgi:hypothetical protein